MKNEDSFLSIVDSIIVEGKNNGILQLSATDEVLNGRIITINNQAVVNFGSCSYLGLEMQPELKQGAIDATNRFGTQFSASRAYLSAPPYIELQQLLTSLFNAYPIITASTTLGHIAALPVLIGPKDALIIDLQVHNSVQLAASQCRLKGSPAQIIPHNNMDLLEENIREFRKKGAKHIWYFADGVYSMYGDLAPVDSIIQLLDKYENFYAYIDDAHGMSWYGKNGRGTVLGYREIHPKMVVAVSMNKAFAAAGGVIILPNSVWQQKIMNCGSTLIFSGPIQPPMLGAAIASAKIHLSDKIHHFQRELHEKIKYFDQLLLEHNLPLLSHEFSVIRFIGIGQKKIAIRLISQLMTEGYCTNLATFPAVPMKRSGVRITINRNLTKEDIKGCVQALHYHLNKILEEEDYELDFINTFKDAIPQKPTVENNIKQTPHKTEADNFKVTYTNSITDLNQSDWDLRFKDRGAFNYENLLFLEQLFSDKSKPEHYCQFHYFSIYDGDNNLVLLTFFITTIMKDDIFSPPSISEKIEEERKQKNDPYYFTSKVLMMGSLMTEGNHLYLDRSKNWRVALNCLFKAISNLQEKEKIEMIFFRDLPANDLEMADFMLEQGYVKVAIPDSHILENSTNDYQSIVDQLQSQKRYYIKSQIMKNADAFEVEIIDKNSRKPSSAELDYFYQLYLNVKNRGLEINVFDLPKNMFEKMLTTNCWELILIYLKQGNDGKKTLVSVTASVKTDTSYCPILIGLNYDYVKSHNAYQQSMYYGIQRGIALHTRKIYLGLTASLQKRRLGAKVHEIAAYIQCTDTYKLEVLAQMNVEQKKLTD